MDNSKPENGNAFISSDSRIINTQQLFQAADEVLRSSERMVRSNIELFKQTPESDGEYYDPDWDISLTQKEANDLARNLKDCAKLFGSLAEKWGAQS